MTSLRTSFSRLLPMVVLGAIAATSHAVVVYQNDFESGSTTGFTNGSVITAPNNSTKFLGRFSGDGPMGTVLSLSGLDPHNTITLNFDLYLIQSWDGTGNLGSGPDILRFIADSTTLVDATFANRDGSTQSYSDATPLGGGPFAAKTDADAEGNLGYGDFFGTNTVYNMSFTFAHTGSTLNVSFDGINIQGIGDESWGLDNFVVTSDFEAVPEPASMAALGLGAVALLRRKLRKRG